MKQLSHEEIEKKLLSRLRWAKRTHHVIISMAVVGVEDDGDGWYTPEDACEVCVAGAFLIERRVKHKTYLVPDEARDFAELLGRSRDWGNGFMYGSQSKDTVATVADNTDYHDGFGLGRHMLLTIQQLQAEGKL